MGKHQEQFPWGINGRIFVQLVPTCNVIWCNIPLWSVFIFLQISHKTKSMVFSPGFHVLSYYALHSPAFTTGLLLHSLLINCSLWSADVFPVVASLPRKINWIKLATFGGREATTRNTSALCRLHQLLTSQENLSPFGSPFKLLVVKLGMIAEVVESKN